MTTLANKVLQISGDTPTPTVLFYDSGVTGTANTNYTKSHTGVNASVSNTGTNISCSYYGDAYYIADVLISGDFRATVTFVSTTYWGCDVALLNSSKTKICDLAKADDYHKWWWEYGASNETITINYDPVEDSPVTYERVGDTLTVKCNGAIILTKTIVDSDVYFAFKTHSAGSRNFTFKELTIESLDTPYSPCSEYQTQIENAITYINGSGS